MKIKVTKKNFPKVIQALKQIFESPVELKAQYDVKGLKYENISEEMKTYYRNAKITKHWMLDPSFKKLLSSGNSPTPLIYIDFLSGGHAMVIQEGDIVELGNGSTLIVREESSYISTILKHRNLVTSFKKVKLEDIEDKLLNAEVERTDEVISYESMQASYGDDFD